MPKNPPSPTCPAIVIEKKTSANYEWAKDKAHNLKYEAVLLTLPKTNSIVSIANQY